MPFEISEVRIIDRPKMPKKFYEECTAKKATSNHCRRAFLRHLEGALYIYSMVLKAVDLAFSEREQIQPPKFVERMQNYTIKEGQSVTLTARAVGTPTPMMSWQKNNKMLTPNKDYKLVWWL